jgi:hypothetical protein
MDIFHDALTLDDTFDIVLIDIEPHGREIEVYENIKHLMNPEHLCILKHVAFIDLFGSAFADRFLDRYKACVIDSFCDDDKNHFVNMRDVFIVMTRCALH